MKFSRLQKIWLSFLCAAVCVLGIFDFCLWKAFFYNPSAIHVEYQILKDSRIPQSLNNVSVVYISDLEFSDEAPQGFTQAVFSQINELHPDLFLFGGDLFNADVEITEQNISDMSAWISSIQAPLGKFAVLGEQDQISQERLDQVSRVYAASGIEVLNNQFLPIFNQSRESISLAGLNTTADTNPLAGMPADSYCLLLSHWPDNLKYVSDAGLPVSMALAGNSHGTQIDWPLFGGYRKFEGSTSINRARYAKLPFDYQITSGIGCIDVPARLNSPVEICYFTFKNR